MAAKDIVEHEFKPGESGNPAGRPKGTPNAATRYRRLLDLTSKRANPVTGEMENFTQWELMDMAVFNKALKGDMSAYKEIMDRAEGRVAQNVDVTSQGDKIEPFVIYRPEPLEDHYDDK